MHLQKKEEIVPKNAKRGKQRKEKSCKRAKKKTVGSVRFSTCGESSKRAAPLLPPPFLYFPGIDSLLVHAVQKPSLRSLPSYFHASFHPGRRGEKRSPR